MLRFELRELKSQPGLYLFAPMILLQTLGTALTAIGAFDTPVLITPGLFAVRTMNTLTLLVCLLGLFYAVESLRRERNTGISSIYFATPTRTASILTGKMLANCRRRARDRAGDRCSAGVIALAVQGKVAMDLAPIAIVWGLHLLPDVPPLDRVRDGGLRRDGQPVHDLRRRARGALPDRLPADDRQDELGGELGSLERLPLERHGRPRAGPSGADLEPASSRSA